MKHTPGPWKFREATVRSVNGEEWICDTDPSTDNARLIAASPELLEALQLCSFAVENALKGKRDIILTPEDAVLKAKAAIAKAIGTTPA